MGIRDKRPLLLVVICLVILVLLILISRSFTVLNPGGNSFLGLWTGVRSFLASGTSPYDPIIQNKVATHTADWRSSIDSNTVFFIYPFYSLAVFFPPALIEEYSLARTIWMVISTIAVLLLVIVGLRLLGWNSKLFSSISLILISLFNIYTITALILGNPAIITALLIVLALSAIKSNLDELAGICLALSTITPHLVLVLILFTIVWAVSVRRWRLVVWIIGSLGIFIAGSLMIKGDWIFQYIQTMLDYYQVHIIATPGHTFQYWWPGIGAQLGWLLTVSLGLVLLIEWRMAFGQDFRWYLWTASLTLVGGQLLGLRTEPTSFVIMLFPLVMVFSRWKAYWGKKDTWFILWVLVLLVGSWALFFPGLERLVYPELRPGLFFPFPAFLLFGLYWIRWRSIRQPRFWLSDLNPLEG